jgi:hypothetical protein
VHELFNPSAVRLRGDALGAFDVHRLKSPRAMFDIETDRIHYTVRVRHRFGHSLSIADIGSDGFKMRVIAPEDSPALIGVPRCNSHDTPARVQAAYDAPAEETSAAKNSYYAWAHRCQARLPPL